MVEQLRGPFEKFVDWWQCTTIMLLCLLLHNSGVYTTPEVHWLFFVDVIKLLVMKTNWYHQYLDTLYGPSPLPDISESEMYLFMAIIIETGHCIQDRQMTARHQWNMSFCGNMMKQDNVLTLQR
jgi:hypothetical protein